MVQLKDKYGERLNWLLPHLGEWHSLLNYGKTLMKIYDEAGLKELVYGYHKGAAATIILEGNSFDKTLSFLLEAWEAIYRHQISTFLEYHSKTHPEMAESDIKLFEVIQNQLHEWTTHKQNNHTWESFADSSQTLTSLLGELREQFQEFRLKRCEEDETFRLWDQFIHVECMPYFGLYLAIRSGNWHLRNYSIKQMVPIFHTANSTFYKDLLLKHLADLACWPPFIIQHYVDGGWVASITGTNWSHVGFDEAHESEINKDLKGSIPNLITDVNTSTTLHYLPYRAKAMKNLLKQIFPEEQQYKQHEASKSYIKDTEANIKDLLQLIKSEQSILFAENGPSCPLKHIFKGTKATNCQRDGMLLRRVMGETTVVSYIECFILER